MSETKRENSPSANPGILGAIAPGPFRESLVRLLEAVSLHQQRNFAKAQQICESLLQHYPNYLGALYRLGLIHADQNNNVNALDCLINAAMLDPRNELVLTALGEIYLPFGANEIARQTHVLRGSIVS
jgi:tetratricopeptide (TPR) repeat protein